MSAGDELVLECLRRVNGSKGAAVKALDFLLIARDDLEWHENEIREAIWSLWVSGFIALSDDRRLVIL